LIQNKVIYSTAKLMYIFNPDHDLALANFSSTYTPPTSAIKIKTDLQLLPVWYSGEERVIVNRNADVDFFDDIEKYFNLMPYIISIEDAYKYPAEAIKPWGWNPSLRRKLLTSGVDEANLPTMDELKMLRQYSNRSNSVRLLHELKEESRFYCGDSYYFTELDRLLDYLQVVGCEDKVLKMPLSGSGKGLIWILGDITDKQVDWCRRVISQQGGIVAEPMFEKVQDFAMEFYLDRGRCRFVGYSLFNTASSGAYVGNELMSDKNIECRLSELVEIELLYRLRESLVSKLSVYFADYQGYLGVDMMVCADRNDSGLSYKIHPCVEINMRMNMGVVAHNFHKSFMYPEGEGIYNVRYFKRRGDALKFHEYKKRESKPVVVEGKIESGYMSLTPVYSDTQYLAYVLIG
jgi:hypothetical protein